MMPGRPDDVNGLSYGAEAAELMRGRGLDPPAYEQDGLVFCFSRDGSVNKSDGLNAGSSIHALFWCDP